MAAGGIRPYVFILTGVSLPSVTKRQALTTLAAVVVSLAGGVLAAQPAAAATCSDVQVVFARGTGERAGLGFVGTPFVSAVTSALPGRTVSSYAVDYPAGFNQNAGPGATDMSSHISSVAAQCVATKFVIGGYSQGATVTDLAIGIRTGTSQGTPIPANLASRVSAVVVYGNPLNASRGRTIAAESPTYGPKAKEFCNSDDPVCGRNGTTSGNHLSYPSNGTIQTGAQFAAQKVNGG